MFALKSTVTRLERELRASIISADAWMRRYHKLLNEWNTLVGRLNAQGGAAIFDDPRRELSSDDIDRLVRLCHPDRHGGSIASNDMTAKLLDIRKRME